MYIFSAGATVNKQRGLHQDRLIALLYVIRGWKRTGEEGRGENRRGGEGREEERRVQARREDKRRKGERTGGDGEEVEMLMM